MPETFVPTEIPAGPEHDAAVEVYRAYLEQQARDLVDATGGFVGALKEGDLESAMALYASARIPYERIEPVAETFGDLDPRIDAPIDDVEPDADWTGFHPIEQILWSDQTTEGTEQLAGRLVADVAELAREVESFSFNSIDIANGAVELLGEVSASKISGEEERYSHTDLVGFEANLDGAKAAYQALRPIIEGRDAGTDDAIQKRFDAVYEALDDYRKGDGFVSYGDLRGDDIRALSEGIDSLAAPLSTVPSIVAKS